MVIRDLFLKVGAIVTLILLPPLDPRMPEIVFHRGPYEAPSKSNWTFGSNGYSRDGGDASISKETYSYL